MRISDWSSDVCSSDLGDHSVPVPWLQAPEVQQIYRYVMFLLQKVQCPMYAQAIGDDRSILSFPDQPGFADRSSVVFIGDIAAGCSVQVLVLTKQNGIGVFHGGGQRSEEHTSELQSLMRISYAVFCLQKKTKQNNKDQ